MYELYGFHGVVLEYTHVFFRNVTPCHWMSGFCHLEGLWCLHLPEGRSTVTDNYLTPSKLQEPFTH